MKTAKDMIKEKHGAIISVSSDTVLFDALKKMNQHRFGALLVKKGDDIVGIWNSIFDILRFSFVTRKPRFIPAWFWVDSPALLHPKQFCHPG